MCATLRKVAIVTAKSAPVVVSVRDANQGFSKLIARVERGERFIVTKNDREVARIEPAADIKAEADQRQAARDRIEALIGLKRKSDSGWPYKGRRDELHDRSV